jgi:hypothetical protein
MDQLTILKEECLQLQDEKGHHQLSMTVMQARVTDLSNRIAYLEAINRNKSTLFVLQKPHKNKLLLIQRFAALLSPESAKKRQATILFDELYEKKKYFKKYVRTRLKEELRGLIRTETCREIKTFYAPWRILEVMDCSEQSSNQVSSFLTFSYLQFFRCANQHFSFSYRNPIKQFTALKKLSQSGQKFYLKLNELEQRKIS